MRSKRRRGVASVECAVCLPLMVLVVLGSIEACNVIFLQQAVQTTAYEAARVAASPYHTSADAAAMGRAIMDQRDLQGGAVQIQSSTLPGYPNTTLVTANVTLPTAPNRILPKWVIQAPQLSAQCTMVKEIDQ